MDQLKKYFGERLQYTDYQLNLACDLKLIHIHEKLEIRLKQYLNCEEKLNICDKSVYYELLREHTLTIPYHIQPNLGRLYKFGKRDVDEIFHILGRGDPKIRTVVFWGNTNCGKSILARALTSIFAPAYIQRDGGTNVHWLENLHYKSIVIWEEPSVHMSNFEDCKLVFGGETIVINRKNKNLIERPQGAAVVVTTNKPFWHYDAAIRSRLRIFRFTETVESIFDKERIDENCVIRYLLDLYDGRFY